MDSFKKIFLDLECDDIHFFFASQRSFDPQTENTEEQHNLYIGDNYVRRIFVNEQLCVPYASVIERCTDLVTLQRWYKLLPPSPEEKKYILYHYFSTYRLTTIADAEWLRFLYNYIIYNVDFLPPYADTETQLKEISDKYNHIKG